VEILPVETYKPVNIFEAEIKKVLSSVGGGVLGD
jgi:hypothetical protein